MVTSTILAPILRGAALTRVFDRSPSSVQIVDRCGLTVYVNRAFLHLFDVPDAAAVVGRFNLLDGSSADAGAGLRYALERALAGEEVDAPDLALTSFSGLPVWVRASLTPIQAPEEGGGGPVRGVIVQHEPVARRHADAGAVGDGEPAAPVRAAHAPGARGEPDAILHELAVGLGAAIPHARCVVTLLSPDGRWLIGRAANFDLASLGLTAPGEFQVELARAPATRAALEDGGGPRAGVDPIAAAGPGDDFGRGGLLIVPLRGDRRALGALYLDAGPGDARLTDCQIALAGALARQAAFALGRARLHAQTEHLLARVSEARARLDAVIDSAHEGILVRDLVGRVVLANPFAHDLYGLARGRLLGLGPADLDATLRGCFADGRAFDEAFTPGRAGDGDPEEEYRREYVLVRPRERIIRHIVTPAYDQAGELIGQVAVLHDITAERAGTRARDELLAVASHELKTPLTSIKGFAQLLRRDLERAAPPGGGDTLERPRRHLAALLGQLDRLTGLINELLDVARIDADRLELRPERCDLAALARAALERVDLEEGRGRHRFILDTPHDALIGRWDGLRLDQVLTNLLDNAVKYSPDGGAVRVAITTRDDWAHLTVADAGIGIPAHQLETLFEPFARASNAAAPAYGGFGLGLYIARRIVERHGGQIWAESVEGRGSTFHLLLPLGGEG